MRMFIFRWISGVAIALLCSGALAQKQWDGWDYTFDREITPWSEMQTQLPVYPSDADMIPLDVGSATTHRYFVDARSISIGNDGIVRYTMIIKTSGGATNVSFEGMRCETREQKYYAIGRSDKTWVRARNPQWRYIEFKDYTAHHFTLYREYLCRGKLMHDSAEQIVQLLRAGPQRAVPTD